MQPLQIEARDSPGPAYCLNIEEEPDGRPWYHDMLQYIKTREYPPGATEKENNSDHGAVVDKSYLNEVMMEHSSDAGNAHKCQMNADKINAPTAPLSLANKTKKIGPSRRKEKDLQRQRLLTLFFLVLFLAVCYESGKPPQIPQNPNREVKPFPSSC